MNPQLPSTSLTFSGLVEKLVHFIEGLIPLLIGVALIAFFWGLINFIYKSQDSHAHNNGKALIIWGLIAMFVLISVWGIIRLMCGIAFGSAMCR